MKMEIFRVPRFLFVAVTTLGIWRQACAATHIVQMVDFAFVPQSLTIQVGDSVLWTNTTATPHSSTSDQRLWDSGLFTTPGTFARTFANAGSFGYFCSLHVSIGMVGTVTVLGPDVPPSVTLTNPAPGARLPAPATFAIGASATDADGAVTNVNFLVNGVSVGKATTAPYGVTVSNLAAGTYVLTAKARDDAGLVGKSAPVTITVDAPPSVTLTSPAPNAVFPAPATVTLRASARDPDGAVAIVKFFLNGVLAGKATTVPYGVTVSNLAAGSYVSTALARDNVGLFATSAPVTIKVDAPPSVALTSPASNTVFAAPATFTIQASATDPDGSVTKVNFLVNGALAGKATAAPYSVTVSNLAVGTYVLTAKARDDAGLVGRSAPVTVRVKASASAAGTREAAQDPGVSAASTGGTVEIIRFDPSPGVGGDQVRIYLIGGARSQLRGRGLTDAHALDDADPLCRGVECFLLLQPGHRRVPALFPRSALAEPVGPAWREAHPPVWARRAGWPARDKRSGAGTFWKLGHAARG